MQPAISELDYDGLQKCIHCGFCLQSCPTYRETGVEVASPRGRLALMRAVSEGKLPVDQGFADPLQLCLGCRACETACPSGVPYGRLLEEGRALAATVAPTPWWLRFGLRHLIGHPGRLRAIGGLLRIAQRTGLLRLLPAGPLRDLAGAMPPVEPVRPYAAPAAPPAAATAPGQAPPVPVAFFHGCVQEAFLHGQNQAAVQVMAAAGAGVAVPAGQVCCGALHAHTGDLEGARALARRNIAAFEASPGPIVNHAGGCGTHLKEYGHLLKDDPLWAARAKAFAARVRDLSEFLEEHPLPPLAPQDGVSVTYQDSCHLAHGQKVRRQPRKLIRSIPGLSFREMYGADQCCGSAGIYNVVQPEMAGKVLDRKMAHACATEAGVIVACNPGCYLQMRQGVLQRGLSAKVKVFSLAELLARSLPIPSGAPVQPPLKEDDPQ